MLPAFRSKKTGKIYVCECIHDIAVVDDQEQLSDLEIGYLDDEGQFIEEKAKKCLGPTD